MTELTPLLTVTNLATHIRGEEIVKAVKGVSFSINAGETFALVGESGSGKSMTAFSITRLLPSAASIVSGSVNFQGTDLLQLTEADMRNIRGTGISMIFQEPMNSLNPVMTIGKQIGEAVINAKPGLNKEAVKAAALELLELVSIKDPEQRINDYPHQFSGGMRQRVMIAIALAGEPELLIADEPTTALDVTVQAQVLNLIGEIQKKRKMAVLLITHDLGVVHQIADHVGVMRHGEILEISDSETFFNSPQHEYSQQLFNAVPSLAKRGQRLISGNEDSLSTSDSNNRSNDSSELDRELNREPNIKPHLNEQALSEKNVLEVHDLKTYFPIKKGVFRRTVGYVKAVDGVSLSLAKGKTLALVGESGSGKTTLAKTIIRLLEPYSGRIEFSDVDLSQMNHRAMHKLRSDLQIVFQDPYSSMNPRMLVRDIIAEGMIALGIKKTAEEREQRMLELLELVDLPANSLNRYPHQFSGGQRQRISIARALAVDPKIIICDEPTSALDVSVQAQILNLLKDLQTRLGLSYLFITHNISVVSYIADEVAVMYNGTIVEYGSTEEVILSPKQDYTKTLMSAVPELYKA